MPLITTSVSYTHLDVYKRQALGISATLAAAWLPAREAANAPPGAALSRSYLETRWQAAVPRLALAGFTSLGGGSLILTLSDLSLIHI